MTRTARWDRNEEVAAAELRDGESLRAVFPALASTGDEGGGGIVPGWAVPAIAAVERWQWHRDTRRTASTSLFPLAPRMVMALTSRRILVWSARRRWIAGDYIGFVSLNRVVQAEAVTVSTGWRTVRVDLANEPSVRVKVPAGLADDLAAVLSGRPVAGNQE